MFPGKFAPRYNCSAMNRQIVIVGRARTPIGSFQGELASVPAPRLGSIAIAGALQRSTVPGELVGEVYMGCVLAAGLGQNPARQAAIGAGLPPAVGAVTVSKVCGSGLKAVVFGAHAIAAGEHDVVVAGGMESMSNAPYLLPKAREGYRLGHAQVIDSMIQDGLWDAYGNVHMGDCAELCAREKKVTREEQDAFAAESYRRALAAQASGKFAAEIVPVEVPQRKGPPRSVTLDEEPARGDIAKLGSLRPAFQKDGTVTAGNASSINDGAAALVLAGEDVAAARGWKAEARILGAATYASAPEWFTTAPAGAVERLLKKLGWTHIGKVVHFNPSSTVSKARMLLAKDGLSRSERMRKWYGNNPRQVEIPPPPFLSIEEIRAQILATFPRD